MSFCKFSNECILSNSTQVDNIFINEYLPRASSDAVKVYLYGLYLCTHPSSLSNDLEKFATDLNMSLADVETHFAYWEEQGLVSVNLGYSLEVQYLPVRNVVNNIKKFNKTKYADFNKKAQELLQGRMISTAEYVEYYTLMEVYNIEPKALILIISYCTTIKNSNVGYAYILTVAKNWANEGIKTYEAALAKIQSYASTDKELLEVLKICGIKRMANVDEHDKFLKWKNDFAFDTNTIKFVASKILEKHGKVNFAQIDNKLLSYYEAKRNTIEEIEEYENNQHELLNLAKEVCKNLGLYYDNLNIVVEKYITKWFDLGHSAESIKTLAIYCFENSIKTLEGLDQTIMKLFKLGVIDLQSIQQYLNNIIAQDNAIKIILEKLGLSRFVNRQDRDYFRTWVEDWHMPSQLIDFAIEKSLNKNLPLRYMNKLLSIWHSKNISTKEEAEKCPVETTNSSVATKQEVNKQDLSALFDSLEEIEI